jgi:hypothetical protein
MSTTITPDTATITYDTADVEPRRRVWPAGLVAGAVASAATTLIAVTARAADVDLAVDGQQIPLAGFAQMTMIGAVLGVVLAAVMGRRAHRPRRTFVRTTVALTALSIVPDVLVNASMASKLVLALTHVVAAAIIIPTLASRLTAER